MATEETAPSVASVLAGWESIHAAARAALLNHDREQVRDHLRAHIKHQQQHVLTIERLLRAQDKRSATR
jgi:hypothetical protein